jgi:GNAT superfamily N-acetyltransferase
MPDRSRTLDIVGQDELPSELEPQVQLMDATVGWIPVDLHLMEEARRMGYPAPDYFAVFAVEKGEVCSAVRVIRIPYTMAGGRVETVAAIQGVVTRREQSGRGLARALMGEVHRREAGAGIRFAILWTGHANVAHRLYNSMGYVDVYSPRVAIRKCDAVGSGRTRLRLKRVTAGDANVIERIHAESTKGRVGFTPRSPGMLRALFRIGFARPGSLRLVCDGEEPVGYVHLQTGKRWAKSEEVTLTDGTEPADVVRLLEAQAKRGWLSLAGTFVGDSAAMLRGRGYSFSDHAYWGLLARPLSGKHGDVRKELGATRGSFACQFLDYF